MAQSRIPDCKYGINCYQKNPAHHEKYNHPRKQSSDTDDNGTDDKSYKRSSSPSSDQELDTKRQKTSPTKTCHSLKLNVVSNDKHRRSQSKSPTFSEDSQSRAEGKSPRPSGSTQESTSKNDDNCRREDKSSSSILFSQEKILANDENLTQVENTKMQNSGNTQQKLKEMAERKEMDITKEYEEVMKNLSKSNYFEVFQRRVRYSKKAEYQDLLKTPEFMRHKFLVEMPSDFNKFWEFCDTVVKTGQKPEAAFEKFGLKLAGPFDYLAGKFHEAKIREPGDYLRHWRFYYDPPEFQTIFVMTGTEVHYGYWRDDPQDKEKLLVARNDSSKGPEFEFVGGNCFEAALYYLDKDVVFTPFNRVEINAMKKRIQKFTHDNGIPLNSVESIKKGRNAHVVCKTFHKAGLVVPFEKKTQLGYRNLIESDANLRKILEKFRRAHGDKNLVGNAMEELQSIVTAVNIAVDECDFGTAVELGIDLFCSGFAELHELIIQLLVTGYSMLKRPQFIAIMKAHLENRRKGNCLDMLK